MGEMRKVYNILVVKHERSTPLGRYRHRWKNSIKMYMTEIALEGGLNLSGSG
jgi:hypothetical protein